LAINPLGLVPVIRMEEGELLTENAAILQYIADCYSAAGLRRARGWPAVLAYYERLKRRPSVGLVRGFGRSV
jgi:glutathione S-transferase